jgi:26S proteasome regulatory subunit T5
MSLKFSIWIVQTAPRKKVYLLYLARGVLTYVLGANVDLNDIRKGKSAVVKTSTRQTIFLPIIGLVDPEKLKPGDLLGLNKDSYLVLDTLPAEYDSRVKAMEVDEKPTEVYSDIGGLNQQIEELVEAVVLPMQQQEKFKTLGIKPPKGTVRQRGCD